MALYRACRTDTGATPALALQLDPPNETWEGLMLYVQTIGLIAGEDAARRREEDEMDRRRRGR